MTSVISQNNGSVRINSAKRTTARGRVPQNLSHPKIKNKLIAMPPAYRNCYTQAMKGNNLRAAIHSFCLECVGWQRTEVTQCTSISCPLYPYRPYQIVNNEGKNAHP